MFSGDPGIEEFLAALQQVGADSVAWPQSRVLVDLRGLHNPFSFTEQIRIGEAVGRNFGHLRRAAALVPPERLTNVGVKAANRAGARAAAFASEAETLTWLLQDAAG